LGEPPPPPALKNHRKPRWRKQKPSAGRTMGRRSIWQGQRAAKLQASLCICGQQIRLITTGLILDAWNGFCFCSVIVFSSASRKQVPTALSTTFLDPKGLSHKLSCNDSNARPLCSLRIHFQTRPNRIDASGGPTWWSAYPNSRLGRLCLPPLSTTPPTPRCSTTRERHCITSRQNTRC